MRDVDLARKPGQAPAELVQALSHAAEPLAHPSSAAPAPRASAAKRTRRPASAMRLRSPHHHIKKGLNHPNWLIAAATWLLLLVVVLVLIRLAKVLIDDFWVILIAWMQP